MFLVGRKDINTHTNTDRYTHWYTWVERGDSFYRGKKMRTLLTDRTHAERKNEGRRESVEFVVCVCVCV